MNLKKNGSFLAASSTTTLLIALDANQYYKLSTS